MKKLVLIFLLLFTSFLGYSQQRFRTTHVSFKSKQNNAWTDWSQWREQDNLVVITSNQTVIYSSPHQMKFDFITQPKESKYGEGSIYNYRALDADGYECDMALDFNDQESTISLMILWPQSAIIFMLQPI